MRAIKKINNNVALCMDGKGNELIAFGKGIGFHQMPYEVKDLSQISMTFYRIDSRFMKMMQEIPENVLEVSAFIVSKAREYLNCELNPNLVVSLADHIHFAMIRMKKFKKLKMYFAYDIEQLYPKETELGRYAVKLIGQKFHVQLPESEITNIAMHFVNARGTQAPVESDYDPDKLVQDITDMIESDFNIKIDRNRFSYNRFAMHVRYYVKRIQEKKQYDDDYTSMISAMKDQHLHIYESARRVARFIDMNLKESSSEGEILYLMMHIYRIVNNVDNNI